MGFRDNVKALYDYLIENGYNQKYQIVCSTNDYNKFLSHIPSNVKFISLVSRICLLLFWQTSNFSWERPNGGSDVAW